MKTSLRLSTARFAVAARLREASFALQIGWNGPMFDDSQRQSQGPKTIKLQNQTRTDPAGDFGFAPFTNAKAQMIP